MVMIQGGDVKYIESPDLLPKARFILPVYATETGYVKNIDADMAIYLGAGRMSDSNKIDNTSGIVLQKKIGSEVKVGETVAYVHANDENKAISAVKNLSDAFKYSDKSVNVKSRVLETYGI